MRATIHSVMSARATQRRNSLLVQGFKCNEIVLKRDEKNKPKQVPKPPVIKKTFMAKVRSLFGRTR